MTTSAARGAIPGTRHARIALRVPDDVEHPENVNLTLAVELFASPDLADEIWAANSYHPDLEA